MPEATKGGARGAGHAKGGGGSGPEGGSKRWGSGAGSADKAVKRRGEGKADGGKADKHRRTEKKPTPSKPAVAMIPSYLRARFSDRGSSLRDQPSSRRPPMDRDGPPPTDVAPDLAKAKPQSKGAEGKGKGGGKEQANGSVGGGQQAGKEPGESATGRPNPRRRGETDMELMDNNVLLFGRWYRKLALEGPPELSHLRAFVMDRKAYWGDEIALRVFAGAFKVVLVVVLQAEERLQCVFPPGGGANAVTYIVLTHRGNVPHYRGVSVTGRHVLNLDEADNVDPNGGHFLTPGMVGRLLEDCPDGWEDSLSPNALSFVGLRDKAKEGGGALGGVCPPSPSQSKRRHVVRNANTLKEIKSESGISQLKVEGTAVDAYVIEGFPAGSHFVERIACSPEETNPRFSLSKTPGDGDCLFYAMADVANELRTGGGSCPGLSPRHNGEFSVENLRKMVSQSLTEAELAFFRAANNFD